MIEPLKSCPVALWNGPWYVRSEHDKLWAWHYALQYEESIQDEYLIIIIFVFMLINDQQIGAMQVCDFGI